MYEVYNLISRKRLHFADEIRAKEYVRCMNRKTGFYKFDINKCTVLDSMPEKYRIERAFEFEMHRLSVDAAKMTEKAVMDLVVKLPFTMNQEQYDGLQSCFSDADGNLKLVPWYVKFAENFEMHMRVKRPNVIASQVHIKASCFWEVLPQFDDWRERFGDEFAKIGTDTMIWLFEAVYASIAPSIPFRLYVDHKRVANVAPANYVLTPGHMFKSTVNGVTTEIHIIDEHNAEVVAYDATVNEMEYDLPYTYTDGLFQIDDVCALTISREGDVITPLTWQLIYNN